MTVGSNATGVRHLKWSFGQSMNEAELRYAYTMKSTKDPATGDVSFEWDYIGTPCKGQYISATSVAVLNFFQKRSTVVATYRVLDPNSIFNIHTLTYALLLIFLPIFKAVSVCVVEGEMGKPAIIQYGNMYRINPSLYSEGN